MKLWRSPLPPALLGIFLLAAGWIYNWNSPLQGVHSVRQADTLFAGWSYCIEGSEFLKPRIAHRQDTSGISIGEFPLTSWVYSLPCQLTGQWSESAVKLVTLFILILQTLLWGLWIRGRWPTRWPGWSVFLLIWLFSSYQILHLNISLPDNLALLLVAAAGLCWRRPQGGAQALALGLFVVAFGMRPYFIPLLFLVAPNFLMMAASFVLCGVFYLVWYKGWILQSEINYYATEITPFSETLRQAPAIGKSLLEAFLRNAVNFIGLWWLFRSFKDRDLFLWSIGIFAFVLVMALRAPMIISHHYYLGACFVVVLILMIQGARQAPVWSLWLFLAIGLVNTQHQWQGQAGQRQAELQQAAQAAGVKPGDTLAVYLAVDSAVSPNLYWLKATGWSLSPSKYQGPTGCPLGADWAITKDPARGDGYRVERCQTAPAQCR